MTTAESSEAPPKSHCIVDPHGALIVADILALTELLVARIALRPANVRAVGADS